MIRFRYFLAVLLIAFSTFGCEEEFELFEGGEFYLKLNQPVTLIDGTVLELISIEDSRCPEGVECIWEGRAAIVVSWKRDENFELQLNDLEYQTVEVEQYLVSLIELTPYPTQLNQQTQKIARIKIEVD
ncbi:MAG: hypothetical protein ACI9Z3_001704 [Roseivirga sp.]|jgi:hypothetical protein